MQKKLTLDKTELLVGNNELKLFSIQRCRCLTKVKFHRQFFYFVFQRNN